MFEELKNSLKARLWDFKYTPFMSSFFISFIFFNREYLMIYFTDISYIEKKRLILESIGINWETPLIFSSIYVFVYPLIFIVFYGYTLKMNVITNKLKQTIEKHRLLSVDESLQMRIEMEMKDRELEGFYSKLKNEKLLLEEKEEQLLTTYEKKEKELNSQLETLNNEHHTERNSLNAKIELLENKLKEEENKNLDSPTVKALPVKTVKIGDIFKQNDMFKNIQDEEESKNIRIIEKLNSEEKNFLSVFHRINSKFTEIELDKVLKEMFRFNPGKIDLIISNMTKKGLLELNAPYYQLSELGLKISNKIFE